MAHPYPMELPLGEVGDLLADFQAGRFESRFQDNWHHLWVIEGYLLRIVHGDPIHTFHPLNCTGDGCRLHEKFAQYVDECMVATKATSPEKPIYADDDGIELFFEHFRRWAIGVLNWINLVKHGRRLDEQGE